MIRTRTTLGPLFLLVVGAAFPAFAQADGDHGQDGDDHGQDGLDHGNNDGDDQGQDGDDHGQDGDDHGHHGGGGDADVEDDGGWYAGPCSDGTWGRIGEPQDTWVNVSALTGSDLLGDGSVDNPFATVATAVEAARDLPLGTDRVIALWPGAYDANVTLAENSGWTDPVAFVGCSADEVTVQAADPGSSVIDAALAQQVAVVGVTLAGGTNALNASSGADLTVDHAYITGSGGSALRIVDATTRGTVSSTVIADPAANSTCGWGVEVRDGALDFEGGGVLHATAAGFFADSADVRITDAFVFDTSADATGRWGRAIHTQYSTTTVVDSYLSGSTDASIFFLDPRGGEIRGVLIDFTGAGFVGGTPTGDAIVVSGGDVKRVKIENNFLIDSARAGILIDNGAVQLDGNTDVNSGANSLFGAAWLAQQKIRLDGVDAPSVLWLSPADEVPIDRDPMTCP